MPHNVNRYHSRNRRFLLKILFSAAIFLLLNTSRSYGAGSTYDWVGGVSSDITDPHNYLINGKPPPILLAPAPGSSDNIRIGVIPYPTVNYQPALNLLTGSVTYAQMEFGPNSNNNTSLTIVNVLQVLGPASYTPLFLTQGLIVDPNSNPVLQSSNLNGYTILGIPINYYIPNISVGGTSSIASTASLTLNNQITVTNTGIFTLNSDASGSAAIGYNSSGGTSYFTGTYNVQRYITGGSLPYRGYRLLSSPVNISQAINQTSAQANIGLRYMGGGILTGGPGGPAGGFTVTTTNPLTYLYDESRTVNHLQYSGGQNVGVTSVTGATSSTPYSISTIAANVSTITSGVQVPVGNSYLVYFVGNNTTGNVATTHVPENSVITDTGYLNQGSILVHLTNGLTSHTGMTYTTGTGAAIPGLQQIGNPYASTINIGKFYTDNSSSITPTFWEFKQTSQAYFAINASTGTAQSASGITQYIASGQGFFVGAITTGGTLTFNESEKAAAQQLVSGGTPLLLLNQKQTGNPTISTAELTPTTGLSGLHLQITQDSLTSTQTGIYFSKSWSDKYSPLEDAVDLDGTTVYLSSYSSDNKRLSINQLGDYNVGRKIVKLYVSAANYGAYSLSLADIKNIDTLYNVYLRDHMLNDSVNLRTVTAPYNFNITTDTTSYGANRFDIVLEREALPPYQLLTFTGQKVSSGVQLDWIASNAGTYTGFILQKEGPDNTFSPIYNTQSNNSSKYSFTDSNPVIGNNIYRLAQNDINGNITYSSLITIGYNSVTSNGYFSVYPNPSKDIINIMVNSTTAVAANYTADIYNTSGVLMDHRTLNTYTWTEDISRYKEGVYIIALKNTSGDVLAKSKFIKTK